MKSAFAAVFSAVLLLTISLSSYSNELHLQLNSKNQYYPGGYRGIEECEILSGQPDANTGGNWDMVLGNDSENGIHRILLRWKLQELTPLLSDKNIIILSAKMKLGMWHNNRAFSQKINVYKVLPVNKDWVEGTVGNFVWNTQQPGSATWNGPISGKKSWAGESGCGKAAVDYAPKPVAAFSSDEDGSMRPRYLRYFTIPLDLVKSWILHPEDNAGLLSKSADENKLQNIIAISSQHQRKDYGWDVHHPELVITYLDKRKLNTGIASYAVKSGEAGCVIIVPENASEGDLYAAEELRNHIKKMSGSDLLQISENLYSSKLGHYISIGRTKASYKYVTDAEYRKLGDESYRIFNRNNNMFILGGSKRGSIYGVYDYLESLGIRWYSPEYTIIPKRKDIKMCSKDISYSPKFWYRDQHWNNASTVEWLVRMRNNGPSFSIPDYMGGCKHIIGGGHSLFAQIPVDPYYRTNPEWFALDKEGKRSQNEYCLTNPQLREHLKEVVLNDLKNSNGWAESIWIGQNDGSLSGCLCDRCRKEREEHGGKDRWSANIVSVVNYVAKAVAKEYPRVKIKTFAYSYTVDAPVNIKVADNVTIMLCGNFGTGRNDQNTIRAKAWSKIAKNIEVYTYGGANFGYWWPYPNIWEMGAQYTRALQCGVTAFYVQGTLVGKGAGMVDLRAYLSGRLAWNPDLDVKKETKDFCNGFYGPAGKYIYEYIDWYTKYTKKHNMTVLDTWGNPDEWRNWVDHTCMQHSDALFQKALITSKNNPVYYNHVRRAYLEVLWGSIMINLSKTPKLVDGKWVFATKDNNWLLNKKKLFDEIMAENSYTAMSEPSLYIPGHTQLYAVACGYSTINISNPVSKMLIVPALGGRIVQWNIPEMGGNILRTGYSSEQYSGGYQENGSTPANEADFKVVSSTDRSVILKANINSSIESTRTIELDANRTIVHIKSTYKNLSGNPVTFNINSHPEFAFDKFKAYSLYYVNQFGKWTSRQLWSPQNSANSNYIEDGSFSKGIWMLADLDRNTGIINRFDSSLMQTLYTYHSDKYGSINLELWSKKITLEPGQSQVLEHSYEISSDIKSVLGN